MCTDSFTAQYGIEANDAGVHEADTDCTVYKIGMVPAQVSTVKYTMPVVSGMRAEHAPKHNSSTIAQSPLLPDTISAADVDIIPQHTLDLLIVAHSISRFC